MAVADGVLEIPAVLLGLGLLADGVLPEEAGEGGVLGDRGDVLEDGDPDLVDVGAGEGCHVVEELAGDLHRGLDGGRRALQDLGLQRCDPAAEALGLCLVLVGLVGVLLGPFLSELGPLLEAVAPVVFDVPLSEVEAAGEGCGDVAVGAELLDELLDGGEGLGLLLLAGLCIGLYELDAVDGVGVVTVALLEALAGSGLGALCEVVGDL